METPALSTDSNILTDTFLLVESTSVTIPLKNPVSSEVVPEPATTVFAGTLCVIPKPTAMFDGNELKVNT